MQMLGKKWLYAVDELGKLIDVVEYLLKYASGTLRAKFKQPLIYELVWWIKSVGENRWHI